MTCITRIAALAESDKPATKRFRGGGGRDRADPEVVTRQARITLLAFQAHDDRDEALAFLNRHSDALDGRPLDIAGRDAAGLDAASTLLVTLRG